MAAHRICLAVVLLLGLTTGGCGGSPAEMGGATPEETARAYVEAINAKDGKTVCGLLVESAAYEFRIPDWGECPKFVSAFIGYKEDSGSPGFNGATIVSLTDGETQGELRSVKMRVAVESDRGADSFDDAIWLVERDGRWRLAKASATLYVAFSGGAPADVLAAPDLAAQEAEYEQKIAAEREQEEAEQASFHDPEEGSLDCAGPETSYDDAPGDQSIDGGRPVTTEEAERYATADVRHVEVDTEGEDLCARVTLGDSDIEEVLVVDFDIYSPEQNTSYLGPQLELFLEVQADGRARLVYEDWREEDEWNRHPRIPLPARIGREGDTFSFRVARGVLPAPRDESELPPWDGFLWGGDISYLATIDGERRAVSDTVHNYLAMISHPGGRVFESGARQRGDLPTG
jgi:hypothetical protein